MQITTLEVSAKESWAEEPHYSLLNTEVHQKSPSDIAKIVEQLHRPQANLGCNSI